MAYFRAGTARATHEAQQIDVAKTPLATFESNVSGLYLPEILAYIQATQSGSGDPSPINPRAISGVTQVDTTVCGVNLCPNVNINDTVNAVALSTDTDGIVTMNGTASNSINVPAALFFLKAGSYIFSDNVEGTFPNNASARSQIMDSNNSLIVGILNNQSATQQTSFTLSEDTYIYVRFRLNGGSTYSSCRIKPMIRSSGVTDSTFVPYTGTTATTALGGTYYGGYLNVTTGLLTVTHATATYDHTADWSNVGGVYPFAFQLQTTLTNVRGSPIATQNGNICNIFPWSTELVPSTNAIRFSETNTNPKVYIYDYDHISDLTGFKAMLEQTPLQICYKLKTPQTVQLTPAQLEQLLGQNNVFCSSGDVAVKYWRID